MKQNTFWKVVLCGALGPILWATSATAVIDPKNMCAADKIKAAGRYSMCLLNEQSKSIRRGLVVDFSGCNERLTKNWTRAEERGGLACPTVGDQTPLVEQVGSDAARIIAGLWGQTAIGSGMIETEYDVLSIQKLESRFLSVEAVDGWGDPVPFTAAADDGSCVTVSADTKGITVTAVGELCDETITLLSETGFEKMLEIKVYDPKVMDIGQNGEHLLIKYVDKFQCRWNDANTGGDYDVEFHHAVVEEDDVGWFPLGSTIIGYYAGCYPNQPSTFSGVLESPPMPLVDPRKELMILVKEFGNDPSNPALKAPTSYAPIWYDGGSGGWYNGSVWKAICPAGYAALGVVTKDDYAQPSLDDMRCVRDTYTIRAEIGDWVYQDEGTGATQFLSVWKIGPPSVPSLAGDRAPLDIGAVIACPGPGWQTSNCDTNLARLLLVPFDVAEKSDNQLAKVKLDEDGNIDSGDLRYASSIRIPFTLIPNMDCASDLSQCRWNVDSSPFYRLKREEVYAKIMEMDNRASGEKATQTITYSTGFSQTNTDSFRLEVGLEVTGSGEAKFLGSGGKWEVKVSTKLGWDWTTAKAYSTGTSLMWEMTCPAFTYGVAAQVKTRFHAFSEYDPGPIVSSPLEGGKNSVKWLQYPAVFP